MAGRWPNSGIPQRKSQPKGAHHVRPLWQMPSRPTTGSAIAASPQQMTTEAIQPTATAATYDLGNFTRGWAGLGCKEIMLPSRRPSAISGERYPDDDYGDVASFKSTYRSETPTRRCGQDGLSDRTSATSEHSVTRLASLHGLEAAREG